MVDTHESSLVKQGGEWTIIERSAIAQARGQLAEEIRFVSALLDATDAFIVTVDREGRVMRCNDKCMEVLGLDRSEIQGRHAWEIVAWSKERVLSLLGQFWDAGGNCSFESRLPLPDGRELQIAWSTAGLPTDDGGLACLVATGKDITLHREAERKLQQAYELEHRIALSFQESLLRPVQPIPGVRVGVSYKPAVEAERVGGDFYDIYPLNDRHVVAVVGDVSGKGVRAAGLTETVRSTLRALLYLDLSPADALTRANRVLLDQTRPEQFATVAVALVDTGTGVVQYASAGHPHPLLCGEKATMVAVRSGPPLGAFQHTYDQITLQLNSSDCFVMFTDGLSEARRGDRFFLDELVSVADGHPREPQAMVNGLLEAAIAHSSGPLNDDIAILALQLDRADV